MAVVVCVVVVVLVVVVVVVFAVAVVAWLWATHPDEQFRQGEQAVELAQQNLERLPQRPDFLDTLAAAYAETGDFSRAIEYAEFALQRSKALEQEEVAQRIQERLELYRQSQPYRQSLDP